jgi:hypothetical protein
LNELRVFYGGRGIWVHKEVTGGIGSSPAGVTVGLLHTGSAYADDLHEDGVIYHYPQTSVPGRDQAEVDATKAAMRLRLPVFVVSYPYRKAPTRRVHLGWVEDSDDSGRRFLVSFADRLAQLPQVDDAQDFVAVLSKPQKLQLTKARLGQQRFKFRVFKRYGDCCAVCDVRVPELLDAAHIISHQEGGTDDPRNGLVLCANHHRAFDRGLFAIEPSTLELRVPTMDVSGLGLSRTHLRHLEHRPHQEALSWRWRKLGGAGSDGATWGMAPD